MYRFPGCPGCFLSLFCHIMSQVMSIWLIKQVQTLEVTLFGITVFFAIGGIVSNLLKRQSQTDN